MYRAKAIQLCKADAESCSSSDEFRKATNERVRLDRRTLDTLSLRGIDVKGAARTWLADAVAVNGVNPTGHSHLDRLNLYRSKSRGSLCRLTQDESDAIAHIDRWFGNLVRAHPQVPPSAGLCVEHTGRSGTTAHLLDIVSVGFNARREMSKIAVALDMRVALEFHAGTAPYGARIDPQRSRSRVLLLYFGIEGSLKTFNVTPGWHVLHPMRQAPCKGGSLYLGPFTFIQWIRGASLPPRRTDGTEALLNRAHKTIVKRDIALRGPLSARRPLHTMRLRYKTHPKMVDCQ